MNLLSQVQFSMWKQISGPETDAQPSFAIVDFLHSMFAANGSGI